MAIRPPRTDDFREQEMYWRKQDQNVSFADSKVSSVSLNTSSVDSKAGSVSNNVSIADSKIISVSGNASTVDSKANSIGLNTSIADSKAVSGAFSPNFVDGVVIAAKLAENAVETAKLSNSAVVTDKIYPLAVTTDKLAANAVTSDKITTGELLTLVAQIKDAIIETAKIKDLNVTTIKVAGNAITIPVSAYTAAEILIAHDTWTTIQSCAITSVGAPIYITASAKERATVVGYFNVRLLRDSTQIYLAENIGSSVTVDNLVTLSITDTPSAGAHTYYFQLFYTYSSDVIYANQRCMTLLEVKK